MPRAYFNITAAHVNVTVQYASHSGPTPIKLCRNPGMICPVTGNPEGSFGRFNSHVPCDCWDWPVDVPTDIFGAERSTLNMGVYAERYISVASELTMPVACGLWLLCLLCRLVFRVGLKLALCCKSSLLEVLNLFMLPVPHRQKALIQPGGHLSLFLISS